ncbi:MAG: helix-turn-helix domain-containing protein, partial [Gammaproteobacteria bacterium]|nr:helix-turn-helix domain-containing protein [Gammaproteobacteria bacterium]
IELYGPGSNIDAVLKPGASLISCSLSNDLMSAQSNNPAAALIAEKCTESRLINSTYVAVSELVQCLNTGLNVLKSDDISDSNHQLLIDETLLAVARALSTGQSAQNLSIRRRYLLARRAREYMLERKQSLPSITEICNALHTSDRTLHYAFKEVYGVSPKHCIKAQRLFAAYSDLQTAEPLVKVSDIANHYGFLDMSYFAKDYRKMFGELPSDTLDKPSNRNAGDWGQVFHCS